MSNFRLHIASPWLHGLLLVTLALPWFINLGASSIWDGSEAFYAETPREMLTSGDWLSPCFNFEPRVNKPPLTYWAILISYKLFGISEWAVRLPSGMAAVGVMLFCWRAAWRFWGPASALCAAAVVATTPRIFILERRLPIDMLFLFFLTGTLFFLLRAVTRKNAASWYGVYALAALGFMTKGPVAIVIPAATLLLWMLYTRSLRIKEIYPLRGLVIMLALVLPYYLLSYRLHGWEYIAPFFLSDNLGRFATESFGPQRGFFYYVPLWFSDFFPWSIMGPIALVSLRRGWREWVREPVCGLTFFWCTLVFVIFSLSKNKQEYYIAPMYPVAAILWSGLAGRLCGWLAPSPTATATLFTPPAGREKFTRYWPILYGFLALLLALLAFTLPYLLDIMLPDISFMLRLGPSLILLLATAAMIWSIIHKNFSRGLVALCFSLWIIFLSGALIYVPALETFRPVKSFCQTIIRESQRAKSRFAVTGADSELIEAGYFRTAFPSMTFYLERPTFGEDDYELMLTRLRAPHPVYCVLDSRDYDWFASRLPFLRVLDRRPRFSVRFRQLFAREKKLDRDLVLITNTGMTPDSRALTAEDILPL